MPLALPRDPVPARLTSVLRSLSRPRLLRPRVSPRRQPPDLYIILIIIIIALLVIGSPLVALAMYHNLPPTLRCGPPLRRTM